MINIPISEILSFLSELHGFHFINTGFWYKHYYNWQPLKW